MANKYGPEFPQPRKKPEPPKKPEPKKKAKAPKPPQQGEMEFRQGSD